MSNQKMIIALLGVVAVLLAVIVGVLVFKPSTPPSVADVSTQGTTNPSASTTAPAGMGTPPSSAPSGPFDPAKATKVSGTPKDHVNAYFNAIVKKDWKTAFDLLPTDKQATYGSADAFGQQLASYGANGFKMGDDKVSGDTETISADLNTSGGPFTYIWTFVKYNGAWVVKSRAIGGMGQ
jgi:hypothetical protein